MSTVKRLAKTFWHENPPIGAFYCQKRFSSRNTRPRHLGFYGHGAATIYDDYQLAGPRNKSLRYWQHATVLTYEFIISVCSAYIRRYELNNIAVRDGNKWTGDENARLNEVSLNTTCLHKNPRFDYLLDNNPCAIKIYSGGAGPIKVHRYLLFTICAFVFVLDCTCKCFLGDYALIYISHTFSSRWIIYDLSTKKATRNLAQIKLTRRCTWSKR